MGNLDGNPVVQILGMEHENAYVKEVITFLFTLSVVQGIPQSNRRNIIQFLGTALFRCYGGVGILLPLLLGKMPGAALTNFDVNLQTIFAACIFGFILSQFVPAEVGGYLGKLQDLAVAIVRANAAGAGYEAGKAAFSGSIMAPFACAYIAVNGHEILEKGVSAWNSSSLTGNEVLAAFAGPVYWACQAYLAATALTARVGLVLFRLSADYIDYDDILNTFIKNVKDVTSNSAMKRSRSRK